MYYKSRTDLNIAQLPTTIPAMGPAGTIVTDPDFQNKIVRATDEHSMFHGQNAYAGIGGSADVNTFNSDSTMLYLEDSGGGGGIFSFDPNTMATVRIFPAWRTHAIVFSRLSPNVAFSFKGTQWLQFDLSDRTLSTPPAPTIVCDYAHLLPAAATWQTPGGVEAADTVFTAAYSTTGTQGTGVYVCVFRIGKGYRLYNTADGTVTGDYGVTGAVSSADRYTIHNVKCSKDGEWLIVSQTTVYPGSPDTHGPFFWNIETLTLNPIGNVAWGGHFTAGFGDYFNNDSSSLFHIPYGAHVRRFLTNPSLPWRLSNPTPAPATMGLDDHLSYNGARDGMVVCMTTSMGKTPFLAAWWNEVIGFELNGSGKVYRFCHTFNTGKSGNFYADNSIGIVDQLNKFAAWTSDWGGTLKNPDGTPRVDVFVVALR